MILHNPLGLFIPVLHRHIVIAHSQAELVLVEFILLCGCHRNPMGRNRNEKLVHRRPHAAAAQEGDFRAVLFAQGPRLFHQVYQLEIVLVFWILHIGIIKIIEARIQFRAVLFGEGNHHGQGMAAPVKAPDGSSRSGAAIGIDGA